MSLLPEQETSVFMDGTRSEGGSQRLQSEHLGVQAATGGDGGVCEQIKSLWVYQLKLEICKLEIKADAIRLDSNFGAVCFSATVAVWCVVP